MKIDNNKQKDNSFSNFFLFAKMIIFFVVSIFFNMIFSSATSPLSEFYGGDSAFFMIVGKGMAKGMLPYRDFFDMKGPYLFMIQYVGQMICGGRFGIFIIQVFNLFFCMWIIEKIYNVAGFNKKKVLCWELTMMIPILYVACFTFERGNLTEEYSLPFLLLSLYFALKHIESKEKIYPIKYGLYYGFAFGFLALIRITNAALIGAIILTGTIELLLSKEYKNLFFNGCAFVLGTLIAFLPAVVFCYQKGILKEMFNQVFIFGVTYSSEISFFRKVINMIMEHWEIVLLMLLPIVVLVMNRIKERQYWILSISSFVLLLIAASMGNGYLHYFTLGIPNIVLGIKFVYKYMFKNLTINKVNRKVFFVIMILFALQLPNALYYCGSNVNKILGFSGDVQIKNNALEAKSYIPEEDFDKIYVLGVGSCSNWYAMTDLLPANKYCDWQNHYIKLIPEIENELALWLRDGDSKWLITSVNYKCPHNEIDNVLNNYYEMYKQTQEFILYVKKD